MKVNLWLDAAGMEALAKGNQLYPWHITPRLVNDDGTETYPAPENSFQIAFNLPVQLPDTGTCINSAHNALNKRLQEIRAAAYADEREVQQRINDLLMIGHTAESLAGSSAPSNSDIPF